MAKINCHSCGKKLQIDETKLPMHEVKFACPHCKAILLFNRSLYQEEAARSAAEDPGKESVKLPPPPAEPLPPPPAKEELKPFSKQQKALIVGVNLPGLEEAVKAIGFTPQYIADPVAARDSFDRDHPPLVLLVPRQLTAPPLQEMLPLIALLPADRRESFFILLSNELQSADGDAAFFYMANLVVAYKDLGSFQQIYQEAYRLHQEMYKNFFYARSNQT